MRILQLQIETRCGVCGTELKESKAPQPTLWTGLKISHHVDPCPNCLENALIVAKGESHDQS